MSALHNCTCGKVWMLVGAIPPCPVHSATRQAPYCAPPHVTNGDLSKFSHGRMTSYPAPLHIDTSESPDWLGSPV